MSEPPVFPVPPDFRSGASSAAYQIEGAVAEDGRGESIWDRFCRVPDAVAQSETGDVACDHYHRWREDLDLMAALRLEAYRFSIAWPRVQPHGRGALNRKGVDFYRRLASGLRERDIDPVVTLYHADLPAALQDRGGWASRETAPRFAYYARTWRTRSVTWSPIGSRTTSRGASPSSDTPRGRRRPACATGPRRYRSRTTSSFRTASRFRHFARAVPMPRWEITLNLAPVRAASSSDADTQAAHRWDGHVNRWFLEPLLRGAYPDDLVALFEQRVGPFEVRPGDPDTIATPIDFLGINYYHPDWVRAAPAREPLGFEHIPPPPPTSPLGWQIDPQGLRDLLARLVRVYGRRPIWITENGIPDDPETPAGQGLEDHSRVDYLSTHLEALSAALADGADIRRYFVWALLDSFEWELGYGTRFGLVHVDFKTQRRTPKRSARWYRGFIARARSDEAH
jgi:beta-glucosidase